jgi:predicted SAM-dependent methyltransferase
LTPEQGKRGIQLCYRYLKPGGKLRIAVPDGFNPDHDYHEYAKPGGSGAGADDHKIFYTVESLGQALAEAGFQVEKIEYFDSSGVFHQNNWSESDGYIHRSLANDPRNKDGKPNYTSLIIDGVKP